MVVKNTMTGKQTTVNGREYTIDSTNVEYQFIVYFTGGQRKSFIMRHSS